jgi:hypothetical protein
LAVQNIGWKKIDRFSDEGKIRCGRVQRVTDDKVALSFAQENVHARGRGRFLDTFLSGC